MENIKDLFDKITALALKHKAIGNEIDDIEESSWLEYAAFEYISEYCEAAGLQVEGFPHQKRALALDVDDFDEDYFCQERFLLYVDTLSLQNETVANLNWHYVSSFWPDEFSSKADFLASIKARIESGVFYDVKF